MMEIGLYVLLPLGVVAVVLALVYRHQCLLRERAQLMRAAMRHRDFTFRLPTRGLLFGERALQEALNDMGQDIQKLVAREEVESWQRLTRVLTHEIMNATAPIQSISQAYLQHPNMKGSPYEEGIQAIHDTSQGLANFVDSYRKLTQLQEPVMAPLRLRDFIAGTKVLYPNVSWELDVPGDVVLNTDESLLRQVFVNIVKNAAEANAKAIACSWNEQALRISNDGMPIPAEVRRDIFIPFYTTKSTGTGIGLSLSRQIMTMLGGSLELAERADMGFHTTFVLRFQ